MFDVEADAFLDTDGSGEACRVDIERRRRPPRVGGEPEHAGEHRRGETPAAPRPAYAYLADIDLVGDRVVVTQGVPGDVGAGHRDDGQARIEDR